jgi:hypothetical protein
MTGELKADIPGYGAAGAADTPPPEITPDPVGTVNSIIDQVLALAIAAANSGDPADNTNSQVGHAERQAKIGDATTKFPANEEQSAAQLAGVGQEGQMSQMTQMTGQIPQMASGIAQSMTGALSGLTQPLNQIPQQVAQVGQQAMQAGLGALQHGAGGAAAGEALPGELLGAGGALGAGAGQLAGAGGGAAGAGLGGTTPAAMLGPPPAPSAGTVPMSAPATPPVPPSATEPSIAARGTGMGAMPMMPPGAMHGAGGPGTDSKPDTKRVAVPSVKSGAPVQGRITTPPPAPEVKRVEGKPVATRRILAPEREDGDGDSSSR